MSASEAETIWMSRMAMNIPNTIAMKAKSLRASNPAIIAGPRAPPEIAPAVAMASVERGGLLGACVPGVDFDDDREAGTQLGRRAVRNADTDGHPLGDLGEVAGGVLRRQQREFRAGSGRDALDGAVDLGAVQGVDRDLGVLPGPHLGELRLLEVGFDIGGRDRDQGHEPLPRLDILSRLNGA